MSLSERKLNRWSSHNYNLMGYYFVTLCVQNRLDFFGKIIRQKMILNQYGKIVNNFWQEIPNYYSNIAIDEFVIMPNHIHGIIVIKHTVGTEHCSVPNDDQYDRTEQCFAQSYSGQSEQSQRTEQCSVPTMDGKKYGLLSKVVKSFKDVTIKTIRRQFDDYKFQWQRSFYDRIIRDNEELHNVQEYIINNPKMYKMDRNENV